ncbi:MAG TPA: DUF1868 domain-containing protein [Patescibacteria group bacterium]|nr:DUF1868 domain-containing protein [Patescibacteria group bacterium]
MDDLPITIVSPLVHSEDEHAIVAVPSGESVKVIVAVQDQLKQIFGDAIWLTPPSGLHITIMEIICDTDYKDLSRKQHFVNWQEQYSQAAKDVIASFPSFSAMFNRLEVSQRAIILKAADPKPFNEIRSRLLENIVLPQGTKLPPDIAHCTIARFNKPIDLDDAQSRAQAIACNFTERIQVFKLLKDLGPPDFTPTLVDTYSLGG